MYLDLLFQDLAQLATGQMHDTDELPGGSQVFNLSGSREFSCLRCLYKYDRVYYTHLVLVEAGISHRKDKR